MEVHDGVENPVGRRGQDEDKSHRRVPEERREQDPDDESNDASEHKRVGIRILLEDDRFPEWIALVHDDLLLPSKDEHPPEQVREGDAEERDPGGDVWEEDDQEKGRRVVSDEQEACPS